MNDFLSNSSKSREKNRDDKIENRRRSSKRPYKAIPIRETIG